MKRAVATLALVGMLGVLAPTASAAVASRAAGQPSIRIADVDLEEGNDGVTRAVFKVVLSRSDAATVEFATADGSATAGLDYTAASGTLRFTPNKSTKKVSIRVMGDSVDEPDETFTIKLSAATGAAISDRKGRATIEDDDDGPAFSIVDAGGREGQTAAFTVRLSEAIAGPASVDYVTTDGSATAPDDYETASGTLEFDPGQTVLQVVVDLANDFVPEVNENFGVNLVSATGASISDGVAAGTITDDDTPTIAVANASLTEGNSGTTNAVFSVTLSAMSSLPVTIDYATADGSATSPADYQPTAGTLTFDPGETVQQIVVPVVGDTAIETTEAFSLNLTNPVNATFSDAAAQGTITDNDTVTISIAACTVTEANVGTRDCVFNVTLSAPSGSTVTVDFVTANGSATAPADYVTASGTLTFGPGEVSKQITVQTVGDTLVEANETYSVNLSNPINATIAGSGYGLGTITNND